MVSNGLDIGEREFMSLTPKRQMCVLYKNQVETLKLIKSYRLYYRITSIIGSFLIIGVGILFKLQLGI